MSASPARSRMQRSTAIVIGRDRELQRLTALMTIVPVAVIYGLPGVGKSTLALDYAERWSGPVVYVKTCAGLSIAGISDKIHRQVAVAAYDVLTSDDDRLKDLWSVVDDCHALAIVDDVHAMPAAERDILIHSAVRYLQNGRLVALSRERIRVRPGDPDHLQLRLEALDRASAKMLWDYMIELYGPACEFDAAWLSSQGNPFLLRQAHVGMLAGDHPLESVVRGLDPYERQVAVALALSHAPLPRDVFTRLLPAPHAVRALDVLVARLVADINPAGQLVMHDLFRETILRDLDLETRRAAAVELVDAMRRSSIDVVTRVQESARHMRALADHAAIARVLLDAGESLVRHGANSVLLHELELLPCDVITRDLAVLHALTLGRGLQFRRAYETLQQIVDGGDAPPPVHVHLATFAMLSGRLDIAQRVLERLRARPDLAPGVRRVATHALAWVLTNRGEFVSARTMLDEIDSAAGRAAVSDSQYPRLRLYLALLELDEQAANHANEVLARLQHQPQGLWTGLMCAVALARCGRLAEAEQALAWMARSLRHPEENIELRWTRAVLAVERGERIAPLGYFCGVQRLFDRGEGLIGAVWTRALTARLLLELGRRRQGLAVLAEARAQCAQSGTSCFDAVLASVAAEDPLADGWLQRPAPRDGKPRERTRSAVRTVLQRACAPGPLSGADLPEVAITDAIDHAFDRALLAIAYAIVARRNGEAYIESYYLQRAADEAAAGGADEDLVPEIYRALSAFVAARPAGPAVPPALVIDGKRHEIRAGERCIALASRLVPRTLLYAFASAPGGLLSRDMITQTLWNSDYAPDRHDNSLKTNIRRVRTLIAGTGAAIQIERDGYRLVLPAHSVFVAPGAS